jgi:hypothetical protein
MAKFSFGPEGVAIEEDLDKLVKLVRDLIKAGLTKNQASHLKDCYVKYKRSII